MTRILALAFISFLVLVGNVYSSPNAPHKEETITITAVGDIMLGSAAHGGEYIPTDDGASLLAEATPYLSRGDVVFGNLEGPLANKGTSPKCGQAKKNCFAFRTPMRYAKHLHDSGFTTMSIANNHANDFGTAGRYSTMQALAEHGIGYSGPVGTVSSQTVRGVRVGMIAFTTYPHSYSLLDINQAQALIAEVARRHDVVIVSFHGGGEGRHATHVQQGTETYLGENRGNLRAFTHAAIDAGASIVIGHGPHVVRGIEMYKGKLIAYSIGNFATHGVFNLNTPMNEAPLLEVKIRRDGTLVSGKIHSFLQSKEWEGPRIDTAMTAAQHIKKLSEEDFGANAPNITDTGEFSP